MTQRVYAMMPSAAGEALAFVERKGKDFAAVRSTAGAGQVVVFAPGIDVAAFHVAVPPKRDAEARRAAAYTIEDDLAQPVDLVHVALGPRNTETTLRDVYAIDRAKMDMWSAALKKAGLGQAMLVAETSVLPEGPIAHAFESCVLVSTGGKRFAVDATLPADAMRAVVGNMEVTTGEASRLVTLARYAEAHTHLTDLRQGEYAIGPSRNFDMASWRLPVALAAATAVAWTAMTAYEARTLGQLSDQMETKARATYATAYPKQPVPRNLRQAVRTGEGNTGRSLEFRPAAAVLYKGVQDIEGLGIRSLRYDRSAGVLRASMAYAAYGDELKLKSLIEASGLVARIGDTRQDGALVTGDITLEQVQ